MNVIPLTLHHAPLLHDLYQTVPAYFDLLGTRPPTPSEVERDIEMALLDPRRRMELLYSSSDSSSGELLGSLDYKLDYPQVGDLTINLLLIRQSRQSQGLGEQAVRELEARLPPETMRVLASVLGDNPRGVKFWERLGYTFTLDARPVMTWYAKPVHPAWPTPHPKSALGVASD